MASVTWIKAAIALLGAIGGGIAARTYRAAPKANETVEESILERRNDHTAAFAEKIWTGFIEKLESEIQRKDKDIHRYRMEIARLGVALDKSHERIINMQYKNVTSQDS